MGPALSCLMTGLNPQCAQEQLLAPKPQQNQTNLQQGETEGMLRNVSYTRGKLKPVS